MLMPFGITLTSQRCHSLVNKHSLGKIEDALVITNSSVQLAKLSTNFNFDTHICPVHTYT